MTFDKFFKLVADLTAGRDMSVEDEKEFVEQMLSLSEQQPADMNLIDYARQIAKGETKA